MKRFLTLILAVCILLSLSLTAFAERPISVIVGGEILYSDVSPMLINDRTMLPVRAVFEAIGAKVDYIDAESRVVATKGGKKVEFVIDSNIMTIDGKDTTIDVPATIVNDRTLVPLRACAEAFDLEVGWDDASRTAIVKAETAVVSESSYFDELDGKITTYYEYDENGFLVSSKSTDGISAKYTNDHMGRMLLAEYSDGYWIKTTYNRYGEVLTTEYSDGSGERYEYDENGNITYSGTLDGSNWYKFEYNDRNQPVYNENVQGMWTRYGYTEDGKDLFMENHMGYREDYYYNEDGTLAKRVSTDDTTTYKYDEYGQLIELATGDYFNIKYTYDEFGREIGVEHSDGYWRKSHYDENDRLVLEESAYGSCKYEYDEFGNQTYMEDSDGYWTKTQYNENGKVIKEESPDYWYTYEYDEDGFLTLTENSYGNTDKYIRIVR